MSKSRLNFKPKYEKIVELLLYLAHIRPNADHYQAVKFLYLADKEHFTRYGRPITFDKYCALQYGPVPSNALDLLTKQDNQTILKKFQIDQLPFETEKLGAIIYIRSPKRAVNHDLFSKSDLKIFDEIVNKYKNYTFGDLYKITHDHFAYKNAWANRGDSGSSEIKYEDMMDESSNKADYLDEIEAVSSYM